MGKDTKISWATHTFSPWWGCVEVPGSGACAKCYARTFSARLGHDLWGKDKPRKPQRDPYWNEPLRWNRAAEKAGIRDRVFCASMADVFEDRRDLDDSRDRLWKLIGDTPYLDYLLLTKRHDKIRELVPKGWLSNWPTNIWPGVTTEDQRWADTRIPELLKIPAKVRWLSIEPMLGPIDLTPWLGPDKINWCIVGGESGHGARPMEPEWVRDLLDQCKARSVPFHFKQKGNALAKSMHCASMKGDDPKEWPAWMRVQEFPKEVKASG